MSILTFAKIYGVENDPPGRAFVRRVAKRMAEGIREISPGSTFKLSVLYDERCAGEPGFRLKITCKDSAALARTLGLPETVKRPGRNAGGRDAITVRLNGLDVENLPAGTENALANMFHRVKGSLDLRPDKKDNSVADPAQAA